MWSIPLKHIQQQSSNLSLVQKTWATPYLSDLSRHTHESNTKSLSTAAFFTMFPGTWTKDITIKNSEAGNSLERCLSLQVERCAALEAV